MGPLRLHIPASRWLQETPANNWDPSLNNLVPRSAFVLSLSGPLALIFTLRLRVKGWESFSWNGHPCPVPGPPLQAGYGREDTYALFSLNDPGLLSLHFLSQVWQCGVCSESFSMMGDKQKRIRGAQQVRRISVVQQRRVHRATLEVVDNPLGGADQVSGGLGSRVLWEEGRPLAGQRPPESPQALTAQAHGLSPGTAGASVASLSIWSRQGLGEAGHLEILEWGTPCESGSQGAAGWRRWLKQRPLLPQEEP